MVAYNFKAQFADDVASGKKRQTIRAPRKDGRCAKPGDRLQLYTGMRSKSCRKLVEPDPVCKWVNGIIIEQPGIRYTDGSECMTPDVVARRDGFRDWPEMRDWFQKVHGLPFHGFLIRW